MPEILEVARTTRADGVKITAIKALGSIGPDAKEAIPTLRKFADLPGISNGVRDAALEALKWIQPESK